MKIYMIRMKDTELYSTGGLPFEFVPKSQGKIWQSEGALKRHLINVDKKFGFRPETWEILVFDITVPQEFIASSTFSTARRDGRRSGPPVPSQLSEQFV